MKSKAYVPKETSIYMRYLFQDKGLRGNERFRTRAWLPCVITMNDIPPHIPCSKPYTMVIFPAAFIYHADEEDSALNHMLKWYKVISVTGQPNFEV